MAAHFKTVPPLPIRRLRRLRRVATPGGEEWGWHSRIRHQPDLILIQFMSCNFNYFNALCINEAAQYIKTI